MEENILDSPLHGDKSKFRPFLLNHCIFHDTSRNNDLDIILDDISGNVGNSYISRSFMMRYNAKDVEGIANIFSFLTKKESLDCGYVNENFSHVFLFLQDHLRLSAAGLPWRQLAGLVEGLRRPIVVFSLGANALGESAQQLVAAMPDEMKRAVQIIAERSRSVGVRGHFTAEVLERMGATNYAVVGCPSYFAAGPERTIAYPDFDASQPIAAIGKFSHRETKDIDFFLQDEIFFIRSMFSGQIPDAADLARTNDGYPHYFACALSALERGRMHYDLDLTRAHRTLGRRHSMAVGTRVHGSIAFLNSGLPALCTAGDARAAEMCDLFRIPHRPGICAADFSLQRLYEMADPTATNAAYIDLYRNFANWLGELGIFQEGEQNCELPLPAIGVARRPAFEQWSIAISTMADAISRLNEQPSKIEGDTLLPIPPNQTPAATAADGPGAEQHNDETTSASALPGEALDSQPSRAVAKLESHDARPLLSICIPTYNRADHLAKLVRFITTNILTREEFSIELIIVNNASKDKTKEFLDTIENEKIRIIHRVEHLPTAEENVFYSVEYCAGEFAWFLGDDDIPILENFAENYNILKSRKYDFLLFNPALVSPQGKIDVIQNVKMNRQKIELSIRDLVGTIGCLFTFAGISNGIIRTNLVTKERGLRFMQVSQIYSMVAWVIDAAHNARCAFINVPLVYYRENDYSDGHWARVAARLNVGDHYFWSGGVIALLQALIDDGVLVPADISRIQEVNRDGRRFSLVDEILFKTYLQLKTAQSDPSPRQQISEEQMASLVAFFAAVDPTTHDVVECLKKMARPAIVPTACKVRLAKRFGFEAGHLKYMLSSLPGETFEALEEEFHKRFGDRQAVGPWQRAVRHIYKGYEVLKTPVQFTAIRVGSDLRDSVMEAVDPLPRPPLVVVAATWPELAAQIDEMALLDTVGQSATQDLTDLARASLSLSATLTTLNATLTKQQATLNMLLEARGELNAVYRSTSWTVTYPLRVAGASIRRLVRRIPIRR